MIDPTAPRLWAPPDAIAGQGSTVLGTGAGIAGLDLRPYAHLLTPKMTSFIPADHTPTPKQRAFLLVDDIEAFYGGAAGGGKSDALLMGGLQWADEPGYAGLILRKSYTDLSLPGAIMDRAYAWLNGRSDCHWVERDHRWDFESGAKLQFGYLERAKDRYRYQSAEFQYIAFDELTQFEIDEYMYLATRLRRLKDSRVPIRLRSASNPGGIGHEWVRARFVPTDVTDPDGTIRTVYPRHAAEDGTPGRRRVFIKSTMQDNPHIDRDEYREALGLVGTVLRAQMEAGDWTASAEGTKFKRAWLMKSLVDTAPKLVKRAIYVDLAATEETTNPPNDPDWTVALWGGMTAENKLVIEGCVRGRLSDAKVEALVAGVVRDVNGIDPPGLYPLHVEQEPGAAGKLTVANFARRVVPGYTVHGNRPTGGKGVRADLMASMFERGDVLLVRGPYLGPFIEEYVAFTGDDKQDGHDDQVDAGSGLTQVLFRAASAKTTSYIGSPKAVVVRKGDLVLAGQRYLDKAPRRVA